MNLIERLSWLWILLEVVGSFAVIIGVYGEEKTDRRVLPYHQKEWLKSVYWIILLVGLSIDLLGVVGTTVTSIRLEFKVEELRKSNLVLSIELEVLKQPRTITKEKIKAFIFLTDKLPKFPIGVGMGGLSDETLNYAGKFRDMLVEAGYKAPDDDTNFPAGVRIIPFLLGWNYAFNPTNGPPDISFIRGYTNELSTYYFHYEMTNGYCRPIVFRGESDETNKTFAAISFVLREVGIAYNENYSPDWAGLNGNKILVNQRIR